MRLTCIYVYTACVQMLMNTHTSCRCIDVHSSKSCCYVHLLDFKILNRLASDSTCVKTLTVLRSGEPFSRGSSSKPLLSTSMIGMHPEKKTHLLSIFDSIGWLQETGVSAPEAPPVRPERPGFGSRVTPQSRRGPATFLYLSRKVV